VGSDIDEMDAQCAGDSCVLCDSQKLVSCKGCQIISCRQGSVEGNDCPGYNMDGIETCVVHPNTSYCRPCRAISGTKEVLTQCPYCEEWHCRQDQAWCIGRPLSMSVDQVANLPTAEAAKPEKERKMQPDPLHAPLAEPCSSCLDADQELLPFRTCGADRKCWSFGNKVCEDCAPEGGVQCSNNHKWYCDDCAVTKSFDDVWRCPNCEDLFCRDCRGIERCLACGASSLCVKCSRTVKDSKDFKELVKKDTGAQLSWECAGCNWKMCEECEAKGLGKSCQKCCNQVCDECADVDECCECYTKMCTLCESKQCSCGGFAESNRDQMLEEMAYDEYYDDEYF
jgi:hypothetical protein